MVFVCVPLCNCDFNRLTIPIVCKNRQNTQLEMEMTMSVKHFNGFESKLQTILITSMSLFLSLSLHSTLSVWLTKVKETLHSLPHTCVPKQKKQEEKKE